MAEGMIEVMLLPGGSHTTAAGGYHVPGDKFEVSPQELEDWRFRFQVVEAAAAPAKSPTKPEANKSAGGSKTTKDS